jgi:hypothetical protein
VGVKVAGFPAATVWVGGATAKVYASTVRLPLADAVNVDPATITVPLFPRVPEVVGVSTTETVVVAPPFRTPMLQMMLLFVGVVGQVPPAAVAETKLATTPEFARLSMNATPATVSPMFVIVYVNVAWFPALTTAPDCVDATCRFTAGPNFAANAFCAPFSEF